jgi:dihydrofolate synthase/folylpolyglutamate synthase
VVLDVAHNPQAVAVLMANLDAMGYFSCTRAVFGALSDKDVSAMLAYCDGLVDHWYFTDLSGPRGQLASHHAKEWYHYLESKSAGSVPTSTSMSVMPVPVGLYPTPEAAFAQAQADSASGDRIVVFGSFHTVTPVWAKTCGPRSDTLATA